jgi:hypothetical protein
MTNPAMRDLFMHPANPLGVKSAVLSLLAGDIYGRTPFWPSLWLFKGIYWLTTLARRRAAGGPGAARQLIADVGALPGETVMASAK